MRTCFVILHYLAEDVTCKCLDSILALDGAADINVVVVDNCSPDGSGERLKKKYVGEHCIHFISMNSNEGFARGNNAGYNYARKHFNPDFIVVMNNDVILEDREFTKKIEVAYRDRPFAVLGPDIVTADGRHQNPCRTRALSLNETRVLRTKMRLKLALLPVFYALGRCGKPCFTDNDWTDAAEDCVLHGSCLVFSREFIDVRQYAFNPETFLYCEEDILNAECTKEGLVMRYSPDLKVKHLEDCSTRAAAKSVYGSVRKKYENLVRSLNIFVKTLEKR